VLDSKFDVRSIDWKVLQMLEKLEVQEETDQLTSTRVALERGI
jgi:hypothetical protein